VRPVYINGRFLTQALTGVQRYATEMVKALDALLWSDGAHTGRRVVLLIPRSAPQPDALRRIEIRTVGLLRGQAWEQLELPRYAGRGICLNLCNAAPLAGRSTVVAIHDAGVFAVPETYSRAFRLWYRLLHPALGRRAAAVVTVSEFSRLELVRHLGIAPNRITVIPNGGEHILAHPADPGVLGRLGLAGRYVLAVSSQSPHKNFGGIMAALAHVRQDFQLVFAGGTNSRVFRLSATLPGKAYLAGRVTDGELRALYENAACFVYPSFYEGFGLPPLEAMACGCPVIASRAASLPEVCGDAAMYCDPRDPMDIARAIDAVLGNPELRADLRRRGPERAARFTWDKAARSLLHLLDELPVQ
jgi:glycosyltransferase involved in cell wall biosynthesis